MAEVELNRDNKLCSLCQMPAALFCSKCRVTPYCTVECQKSSWPKHKSVCKLNCRTPLVSSITKVEDNEDFDQQYPFIVINGADKSTSNTLAMTVGRIVGLHDFDPDFNDFRWDGVEDNIVHGFSHEDRFVYRFLSCKSPGTNRNDVHENNLANQFLMIPNCCGSFIIYKSETQTPSTSSIPNSLSLLGSSSSSSGSSSSISGSSSSAGSSSSSSSSSSEESENQDLYTSRRNSVKQHPTLTRREIWEITEYRHFCSFDGAVSDRIHRTNMQRKEGLMTLKKTNFTMLDS